MPAIAVLTFFAAFIPIVGAVACRSFPTQPVRGFFVRKTVKAHGTQKRIEGCFEADAPTLLLEDVTTTGGSVLTAVQALREAGADVVGVAVIVDRGTGVQERIEQEGLAYRFAISAQDLGLAP